jgi:hypothetical protein
VTAMRGEAMRRFNFLCDRDQLRRVVAVAQARGASMGSILRNAIDVAIPADPDMRAAAARRFARDELERLVEQSEEVVPAVRGLS